MFIEDLYGVHGLTTIVNMPFSVVFFLATLCSLCSLAIAHHPYHQKPHHANLNTTIGPRPLNLTTLAGNGQNESVIECWQVANLQISDTPGIQGALFARLGSPSALAYVDIPARFDGGLHNAPAVQ